MANQINKIRRIHLLAAKLKGGEEVNVPQFVKFLKEDHEEISCEERTVRRDIKDLRKKFNAPIEFCAKKNSFYLAGHWEMKAVVDEELTAIILSGKIAEAIVPDPLRSEISEGMASHLATSGRGDLDEAALNSLIVASNTKVTIPPEIFETVFNAWRQSEAIEITYQKQDNSLSKRIIDPLIVAYNNYIWYIKGYCHKNKRIQVFAIHRIIEVSPIGKYYEPDNRLAESVRANGLFDYPRIKDVKVRCHKDTKGYLLEQAEAKRLIISEDGDGLIVILPSVIEHELLHWVLGEAGKVQIIEPESLRQKALEAGKALTEVHK